LFDNKDEYAGVSFIFAGAFTNITGEEASAKHSIGFHSATTINKGDNRKNMDELLVKAGLIPELVGRLTNIVELDRFTEEDFFQILKTRLHPKKEIDLASLGIFDLQLDEARGREMAAHAHKSGQGIRALQRQLEKEYADLEFMHEEEQYLSLEYTGITEE
jgi:ATP-dependent protease Clp ATPase subunit